MNRILLNPAEKSGGKPILDVIAQRRSCKAFTEEPLDIDQLSTLLWAAFGINSPDTGRRTTPSARNIQEVQVFVILEAGAYLYDPQANQLEPVTPGDFRALSAVQPDYQHTPLHLAYVADYSHLAVDDPMRVQLRNHSYSHAGFVGQNVYLYCASTGLGTCFVASFDETGLAKVLGLSTDQHLLYTQVVGHPAE